ncbi:MAG: hypothetical protein IKH56_07535 [Oscillospiraceae bacterium]|nr:hypothetical protein [Oscillospiraceae bacterium]
MSVFSKRSTAAVITVVLCVLALVIGVRRSVGRRAADILDQFESGVRSETAGYTLPSVSAQLEARSNAALGLISLSGPYGDLTEKADAVREAREALLSAGSISARSEANAALAAACDALIPGLEAVLTDPDRISALKDYAGVMSNTARLIETSGYNELVSDFRSNVLGLFPVSILYRIAGVAVPDYF